MDERFIRALNPFIGAITVYDGFIVKINSAKVINKPHNLKPGTISNTQRYFRIACGKGLLEIESLQYGGFFIGTGKEFVERVNPKKGEMFTNE